MFGRNLGEVLLGGIMGSWGDNREVVDRESVSFILSKIVVHCLETISYLESSFLTAHGLTKRTTLQRSVRGAVLIGCSKTMQMTGSKSEIQYGGPNSTKNCLQAWTVNVCKCCHNIAFESKHPVDLYWPKVTKESILLLL